MELHEESVGSCSPGGCAGAASGCAPARRWTMADLDCPLLEPLAPAVRAFYEEQRRVHDAWDAEIERKIAEVEWARKHPEEAARRAVERHTRGAAGPAFLYGAPDTPSLGVLLPPEDLCESSPCVDAQDAANRLNWGNRMRVSSESAADLGPGTPVCFNGSSWMAVDAAGRAFVVHTRGDRVRLIIFEANNPSNVYFQQLIDPTHIDPDAARVAAPCVAVSAYGSRTAFTIAFVGSTAGAGGSAMNRLFVTQGTLDRAGRVANLSSQRLIGPASPLDIRVANPSVFHDNLNIAHVVVALTIEGMSNTTNIAWLWAPHSLPSMWRYNRASLGPGMATYTAGFPSVAARWDGGRVTVVVACKFSSGGRTGVYVISAGGTSLTSLAWTSWTFIAGIDVDLGAQGTNNAADPSVWVNLCGRFFLGYQEVVMNGPERTIRPVIATNAYPVDLPSGWTPVLLQPSAQFSEYVCLRGSEDFVFAVWQSQSEDESGIRSPTWAGAVGVNTGQSPSPDWMVVDATSDWSLMLRAGEPDMLVFPTSCVVGEDVFVAWLYVDRTQIPGDVLGNPTVWANYPSAVVDIYFLVGRLECI